MHLPIEGKQTQLDLVDLEVQCLTREGVALDVHRSMLGIELRILIAEKLPRPGARTCLRSFEFEADAA